MIAGPLRYDGQILSELNVRWCSLGYYLGRAIVGSSCITRQSNYYPIREAAEKALEEYPRTRLADFSNVKLYDAEDGR
jgi:hypothetical protein